MISALYQKSILAQAAAARGAGRLERPSGSAEMRNPLCGDHVVLDVTVEDGRITAIGHDVKACVLCQASASILAGAALGLAAADIDAALDAVAAMLKDEGTAPGDPWQAYGDMRGVAPFGNRHRCVLLPLEATRQALAAASAIR